MKYTVKRAAEGDIDFSKVERAVLSDNMSGGAAGLYTDFALAYNDSGLHFCLRMEGRDDKCSYTGYNEPLYDEEVVEIFIADTDSATDYLETEFNILGAVFAARIDNDGVNTRINYIKTNPIVSRVKTSAEGWSVTGVIGAHALKKTGGQMRFNVYRIVRRGGKAVLSAYSPTYAPRFHITDKFAELEWGE